MGTTHSGRTWNTGFGLGSRERAFQRAGVRGGEERSRQLAKASKRHPVALTPKHFPKQKDFTVRKDVSAALRV